MKEVELDGRPYIELEDVTVIHETSPGNTDEGALLCKIEDSDLGWDDDVWIPKKMIHEDSEVYKKGTEGKLIITEWIAKQKGFL